MSEISSRDARPSAWSQLARFGDVISKFALVAGGLFAVVQFLDARHDAKVERTITYITRFEDGRVSESRRAIANAIRPYIPQFREMEAAGGVTAEDRRQVVMTLVDEGGNGDMAGDIDTVVDFYEGLWTCVHEDLCAADVAYGYFGEGEAPEFWQNFLPYMQDRRENNPAYAVGLEHFATEPAPTR